MRPICFIVLICTLFATHTSASDEFTYSRQKNSFGVGLGLNYGVVGFSYDRKIARTVAFTVGFGAAPFLDANIFSVGLKYYLLKAADIWQPRVMLLFGKNAWANYKCRSSESGCPVFETQSYNGFTLGVGQAWALGVGKKHILDLDVLLRLYSYGLEDDRRAAISSGARIDESTYKLSFSAGYRYRF